MSYTKSQIESMCALIRDETGESANTASRVGGTMKAILEYIEGTIPDISTKLDSSVWTDFLASDKYHSHTNKSLLDLIDQGLATTATPTFAGIILGNIKLEYDSANNAIKVVNKDGTTAANFYATGGVSALGANTNTGGTSGGLITSVYGYSGLGGTYADTTLTDTFNAYTINKLAERITTLETGGTGTSGLDENAMWAALLASGTNQIDASHLTTALADYAKTTSVPTKVSQLNNDSDFITSTYLTTALADYAKTSAIPTKVSAFTNDAGYLVSSDLSAYAKTADLNISSWNAAADKAHTHSNKSVLDGITSTLVTNWNTASDKAHTHSNKSYLDVINQNLGTAYQPTFAGLYCGDIVMSNNTKLYFKDSSGAYNSLVTLSSANEIVFGESSTASGYASYFRGKTVTIQVADGTSTNQTTAATFDTNKDLTLYGNLTVQSAKQINIGGAVIKWDSTYNALCIDGTIYATGGVSALGLNSNAGSGTIENLTVSTKLTASAIVCNTIAPIDDSEGIVIGEEENTDYVHIIQDMTGHDGSKTAKQSWIISGSGTARFDDIYYGYGGTTEVDIASQFTVLKTAFAKSTWAEAMTYISANLK